MTRRRRARPGAGVAPEPKVPAPEGAADATALETPTPSSPAADEAGAAPAATPGPPASAAPATAPALQVSEAAERFADDVYRVQLGVFEGPLDLLLHLIQKHELDIFDIPVSFITKKYLEYLELMRSLQIDVASEYLVMAATLAHIKSQMLLPEPPAQLGEGEEGAEPPDPRAELVRRLLEYQKYRDAAARLSQQPILGRDVFGRGPSEPLAEGPVPFAQVSVFKLFEVFDQVLKRAGRQVAHEVTFDRISITERIVELTEMLHDRGRMRFEDFLVGGDDGTGVTATPYALVITFMAMLEMCRLGVARIAQTDDSLGEIFVEFSARGARLPARPPAAAQAPEPATLAAEEVELEALGEESFEEWLAARSRAAEQGEPAVEAPDSEDPSAGPIAADPPPQAETLDAFDDPARLADLDGPPEPPGAAMPATAADGPATAEADRPVAPPASPEPAPAAPQSAAPDDRSPDPEPEHRSEEPAP